MTSTARQPALSSLPGLPFGPPSRLARPFEACASQCLRPVVRVWLTARAAARGSKEDFSRTRLGAYRPLRKGSAGLERRTAATFTNSCGEPKYVEYWMLKLQSDARQPRRIVQALPRSETEPKSFGRPSGIKSLAALPALRRVAGGVAPVANWFTRGFAQTGCRYNDYELRGVPWRKRSIH